MDRATIQYGQLSLETDLLRAQQYAMIGIGKLFEAIVGTSIAVDGFSTVPTSPASMSVNVGPGQVYQQANLEATPWSSLPADLSHTIVKQGVMLDTATQTFVAPTTVGFAQNFLIQVAYSDADSGLVVRPYYNAANPSVPFNGPGNAGTQDSTVRAGIAVLTVKAGVAATSGSQNTPAPDAGYAGLYVVTVAYGQTSITAGNISKYSGAPFITKLGGSSAVGPVPSGIQYYLNSTTFIVPTGVSRIRCKVWGAGGGGGHSVSNGSGAGGNGGGYSEGVFTVTPGQSLLVTVGAPGTAGMSGGAGGTGGTSSVGSLLSATGGPGGGGSSTSGAISGLYGVNPVAAGLASPGNGSGGQVNVPGGQSANAYGSPLLGSAGGGAFGSSANGVTIDTGIVANFPAGGGGGSAKAFPAAAGGGGLVIIEY